MASAQDVHNTLLAKGRTVRLKREEGENIRYYDSIPALFDHYTPAELGALWGGGQNLYQSTDSKIMLSALCPVVPNSETDMIRDSDGEYLRIVSVTPFRPANELLFYWIQARR